MDPTSEQTGTNGASGPPPPIMGSWRNLYLLVLGALVVDILLLRLFTGPFS